MGSNPVVVKRNDEQTLVARGEEASAINGDVIALIPSEDSIHFKVTIKPSLTPTKNTTTTTPTKSPAKSPQKPSMQSPPSSMKRKRDAQVDNEEQEEEEKEEKHIKRPKLASNNHSPVSPHKNNVNDPSNPVCRFGHNCYR